MFETHYGRVIYSGRANWVDASTGSRRWKHEGERVGRTGISLALALERIGWKQRSARSKRWLEAEAIERLCEQPLSTLPQATSSPAQRRPA